MLAGADDEVGQPDWARQSGQKPPTRTLAPAPTRNCPARVNGARTPFARLKSIAALVILAGLWGRSGAFCRCSAHHKMHRDTILAAGHQIRALPPKPVTGGSADGLPIAQAYATRAGLAFTAA